MEKGMRHLYSVVYKHGSMKKADGSKGVFHRWGKAGYARRGGYY